MSTPKSINHQSRPFVFLAPTHLKQAHEDLKFLFQYGDYSCGSTSNYSAFDDKLKIPTLKTAEISRYSGCQEKPKSERYTRNKINKTRQISEKFARLKSREKYIAQLFFYEQQFDPNLEGFFGFGIKLIPYTSSYSKLPANNRELHKIHYFLIHKKNLMEKIKEEVKELYLSVLESYVKS